MVLEQGADLEVADVRSEVQGLRELVREGFSDLEDHVHDARDGLEGLERRLDYLEVEHGPIVDVGTGALRGCVDASQVQQIGIDGAADGPESPIVEVRFQNGDPSFFEFDNPENAVDFFERLRASMQAVHGNETLGELGIPSELEDDGAPEGAEGGADDGFDVDGLEGPAHPSGQDSGGGQRTHPGDQIQSVVYQASYRVDERGDFWASVVRPMQREWGVEVSELSTDNELLEVVEILAPRAAVDDLERLLGGVDGEYIRAD